MSEPKYSVTTERVYARLPEVYRVLDSQNDWQFKKYISSIVDQLDEIEVLTARLDYVPPESISEWYASEDEYNDYQRPAGIENPTLGFAPIYETSDLLDGRTADDDWLAYLGQLVSADLTKLPTDSQKRDAIINNYLGFRAGSREALEDSIKGFLIGTKYSRVYPHRDGAGGSIDSIGTEWDVLIVTREEETPSAVDLIQFIIDKGAKPAGVVLHHISYNLVWSILESLFPTWTSVENLITWDNFESAGADNL